MDCRPYSIPPVDITRRRNCGPPQGLEGVIPADSAELFKHSAVSLSQKSQCWKNQETQRAGGRDLSPG